MFKTKTFNGEFNENKNVNMDSLNRHLTKTYTEMWNVSTMKKQI
nr:hypothetical protein [Mycoplasmopsis bovis]